MQEVAAGISFVATMCHSAWHLGRIRADLIGSSHTGSCQGCAASRGAERGASTSPEKNIVFTWGFGLTSLRHVRGLLVPAEPGCARVSLLRPSWVWLGFTWPTVAACAWMTFQLPLRRLKGLQRNPESHYLGLKSCKRGTAWGLNGLQDALGNRCVFPCMQGWLHPRGASIQS